MIGIPEDIILGKSNPTSDFTFLIPGIPEDSWGFPGQHSHHNKRPLLSLQVLATDSSATAHLHSLHTMTTLADYERLANLRSAYHVLQNRVCTALHTQIGDITQLKGVRTEVLELQQAAELVCFCAMSHQWGLYLYFAHI